MVVAPVGTVLKRSLGKRNLGGYASTVDNVPLGDEWSKGFPELQLVQVRGCG